MMSRMMLLDFGACRHDAPCAMLMLLMPCRC